MRSHPSCWNKTLAQLGFKRKRRKSARNRDLCRRRSLFEMLEERQMLTSDPVFDPSSDEIIVTATSEDEPIQLVLSRPEFYLMQDRPSLEELDGVPLEQVEPLFVIETVDGAVGPKAILSFNPAYAGRVPSSLQKLQIELRQSDKVIDRYEVLIDIAEESFREKFLTDRIAEIEVKSDVRNLNDASEITTRPLTPATDNGKGRF